MEKSKGEYQIAVKSPNERLELTFELLKGVPHYSISRDHRVLIDSSSMMIRINDEHASPVWRAEREQRMHHDEQWKPVWGIVDEVRNHYHELKIFLADGSKVDSSMNIVFRLFDDGAAFRYEWPDRNNEHKQLEIHEESAFQMDNDRCWFSVEGEEIQSMNEGGIRLQAFKGGHTPMTIELSQKCYIAIHEADVQNYELSELLLDQQSFQLIMKASSKAIAPHQSPWRTMTIVDRPGQLVTSHLIENLNPSSVIADTSWIRPGKSMWDWRNHGSVSGDFVYGLNTASMKRYIDFASTHNFQFLLIDAGWYGDEHDIHSDPTSCIEDVDIQEIIGYAAGKGIGVWLYINDKALKHFDMDHTLAAYREWGIAGIKHGFLQSVGQDRVEFTRKVVAACAAHQLMYVPHEPARPWGLHRTYPNFMSCEFINGPV